MGNNSEMKKAVFLDRDGVINELILNPKTSEYEPPKTIGELQLYPYAIDCLHNLQNAKYELFLVSNQPDHAKGKVSLEDLIEIGDHLFTIFESCGISFRDVYYCFHHPMGTVEKYSYDCECRKPKPFFLLKAKVDYHLDLGSSWMVGDRDSDILCGQAAGTKTILLEEPKSAKYRHNTKPDYTVKDLLEATTLILRELN